MLNQFLNHLNLNFPHLKEKKLLLAVSGGMDSMVLLHLFQKLNYNLAVAHCNFQLRGADSDGDEALVSTIANKLQVPVFIKKFDTEKYSNEQKLSIQLAARKLRYNWFSELLNNEKFDFLLTAHHSDDNLETFLINLSRGTGLEGLTGIPAQNDKIIRPLLPFSREEIETYAKENNVKWREDLSNASDKYLRNKIRHTIVPILKEINPAFLDSFQMTQNHLVESQSLVNDAATVFYKEIATENENGTIHFDLNKLLKLPNYSAYLYQWLKDFGFTAWADINDLPHAQSGKQVFSDNHVLLKNRDFLILSTKISNQDDVVFFVEKNQKEVKIPLNLSFCKVSDISNANSNCIFVDEDKLQFPLSIRKWVEGDVFYPFGMQGKKKLSKYFKDEKLSLIDKKNQWLLCSDNHIVWVIGKRQDNRFKTETNTTNILQIQLQ